MIRSPARIATFALFCLILVVGIALRFGDLGTYPPAIYPDEALYGNLALRGWATGDFQIYYPVGESGEGLYIWLDAPILALLHFKPWAVRVQPALVGCLCLLALWGCAVEFARNFIRKDIVPGFKTETVVALGATFFLASSTWAVHLSRMVGRAGYVPLFTILVLWTLLAARRRASNASFALCGVVTGLALYTYPAARILPAVVGGVFLLELLPAGWLRRRLLGDESRRFGWVAVLVWFGAVAIVFAPLAVYFAHHPEQYLRRLEEVGVASTGSPALQFLRSILRTAQSFFFFGDGNWRHNVSGAPLLSPLLAILLLAGIVEACLGYRGENDSDAIVKRFGTTVLVLVTLAMGLPTIVTTVGIPHALRSSGMLIPFVIFAAIGTSAWLGRSLAAGAGRMRGLGVACVVAIVSAMLVQHAVYEYFWLWGPNPKVWYAYFGDLTDMAHEIGQVPASTEKYVVADGTSPADDIWTLQPIEFLTNTATPDAQQRDHLHYMTVADLHAATNLNDSGFYFLLNDARLEHVWLQKQLPDAHICDLIRTPHDMELLAQKDIYDAKGRQTCPGLAPPAPEE